MYPQNHIVAQGHVKALEKFISFIAHQHERSRRYSKKVINRLSRTHIIDNMQDMPF